MPVLTANQVTLHMRAVPHWSKRAWTIRGTFKFDGFLGSIAVVNRVARKAPKVNHH